MVTPGAARPESIGFPARAAAARAAPVNPNRQEY
ncbi:hypothetical protein Bcav_2224 [Beutenbergia cavernae DSM 12333]|uniref:Uncharacterized protein n=1 Tax=Beutenbergia cavernae (strain ATCC BAA-8 / DSM 12333 / CCUG 43141 / JCM 11478 / NBRC 16432 / NCIMB 13614 / HKI 0122) TaxID=471853 RepID=C5BV88_BEUC1|nr:hypothetical protein Bcav_2224 [Beutenbergia cavernae DSM 12333]